MTHDDVIRFGEQADEAADRTIKMRGEFHPDWHELRDEKFAALVAAAEREACARLLDDNWFKTQSECAAAIRARGEA